MNCYMSAKNIAMCGIIWGRLLREVWGGLGGCLGGCLAVFWDMFGGYIGAVLGVVVVGRCWEGVLR